MQEPPARIRALQALIAHPNTPENEREYARRLLRKLMEKYNLNEADLDDNAAPLRLILCPNKHWQAMTIKLAIEIKDNVEIDGLRLSRGDKRGHTVWHIPFTAVEYADFRAALAWYCKMLEEDTAAAKTHAKRVKRECLEKMRVAAQAVKEVHPAFMNKYKLAEKQYDRWYEEKMAQREKEPAVVSTTALVKPAPAKKMTQKEIDESNRRWKARREAEGFLQDGDRWEKGIGEMGTGGKELGNGETFQLSNE